MTERFFQLPGASWRLTLSSPVLHHLYRHQQKGWRSVECGGQLFSPAPHEPNVVIQRATGPYSTDKATYSRLELDTARAATDRIFHFHQGLHCVGLWHTHPEPAPHPSGKDRKAIELHLQATQKDLNGFLMVIVGNKGPLPHLSVWAASEREGWLKFDEQKLEKVSA